MFPTERARTAASAARRRVKITIVPRMRGRTRPCQISLVVAHSMPCRTSASQKQREKPVDFQMSSGHCRKTGSSIVGGYTRSMLKRLCSVVVALAIAGVPVGLVACQIACASTVAHPMDAHDVHQVHHHVTAASGTCHEPPAAAPLMSPQAPPCNHDSEVAVARVTAARASDAVSPGAAAASPIADVVVAASPTFLPSRQSMLLERLEIRLARPLRI